MAPAPSGHGSPPEDTADGPRPPVRKMEVRAVASGALGSALEYFDFALYGALSATIFPALFFSDLGSTAGLLASFATFGVGFLARPLGAIIFGHLGDRYGRKPILFATLVLMGLSSIAIGLLPAYQGALVASALVFLRFLQGVSVGGEATGNQLMVMEHGAKSRRGLLGSFITMGSPISQVLANLALAVLSATLTTEQFESWGWRIPFLGSILIVAIAVFIRLKLEETPAFIVNKAAESAEAKPAHGGLRVLRSHPLTVTKLTLCWGGPAVAYYLVTVYGLNYLTKEVGMARDTTFAILMIANGLSVVACVIGGALCDRVGRKPIMIGGLMGAFLGVALFFTVGGNGALLTGFIVTLVCCSIQFLSGAQPAFFAEQFPTEVRFSGAALSHTCANMIFAAPSAFIAAALASVGGNKLTLLYALVLLAISMFAVSRLREGRHLDLEQYTERDQATVEEQVRL